VNEGGFEAIYAVYICFLKMHIIVTMTVVSNTSVVCEGVCV